MHILQLLDFKYYNIQPINLLLQPGTCLGVSGPSGSGKSLFLRALINLEDFTGQVVLNDVEMSQCKPHRWRKQVGMLPAESQWWYDTVGEHFADHADFASLGLDPDVPSWPVIRLSTGEKQRLSLLRLLQNQPSVLLLDEPTSNLDPEHTIKTESLLSGYIKEHKAAMIWVSHDFEQLKRVANIIYRIEDDRFQEVVS